MIHFSRKKEEKFHISQYDPRNQTMLPIIQEKEQTFLRSFRHISTIFDTLLGRYERAINAASGIRLLQERVVL